MPVAVFILFVICRMCTRIGALYAVRIEMALDTRGIGTLYIVTSGAGFNISSCKYRVFSASGTNAYSHKIRLEMRNRSNTAE